jgi:DnaK suppressor protein
MINKKVLENVRWQLVKVMNDLQDAVSRKAVRMKAAPDNLPDLLDQAATEHDRSLDLAIRVRESQQIKEILEAIQRIDRGHFGICVRCGKDISPKRLLRAPISRLCAPCKEKTELYQKHRGSYPFHHNTAVENHAL